MSTVHLVGAGPGDPELLTLKAARLLAEADIVLHDSLVDPRILDLCTHATLIDVGKRCGLKESTAQSRINALLVEQARGDRKVVRLKGGDPMIFGRADEEIAALRHAGIGFEIVPGVTSAAAAAAFLQTSLTRRKTARAVHFITGHAADGDLPPHDWAALARAGGTLVVYMGSKTFPGLAAHLIEAGMDPSTPAVAVENAARPEARAVRATLATLSRALAAAAPPAAGGPTARGPTAGGPTDRGPTAGGPILILIGEAMDAAAGLAAARPAAEVPATPALRPAPVTVHTTR